jgi:hypothetical protein
VQVRETESLMRRWSHHLNLWVQDYFGSGTLGDFHTNRIESHMMTVKAPCDTSICDT